MRYPYDGTQKLSTVRTDIKTKIDELMLNDEHRNLFLYQLSKHSQNNSIAKIEQKHLNQVLIATHKNTQIV